MRIGTEWCKRGLGAASALHRQVARARCSMRMVPIGLHADMTPFWAGSNHRLLQRQDRKKKLTKAAPAKPGAGVISQALQR